MSQNDNNYYKSRDLYSTSSQQPLSLLAIKSNHGLKMPDLNNDLLTTRILETSERKIKLIKKLLSPDEYNSIASELSFRDEVDQFEDKKDEFYSKSETNSSNPLELNCADANDKIHLKQSDSDSIANISTNIQDNLHRKRDALEFFFHEPASNVVSNEGNLAIELRSGQYLSQVDLNQVELMKSQNFSLFDRFYGLLNFFQFAPDNESSRTRGEEDKFVERHKNLNNLPYTRSTNLLAMKRRLNDDGQLDKILELKLNQKQNTKLEGNGAIEANEPQNIIRVARHFNCTNSIGPKHYSDIVKQRTDIVLNDSGLNFALFKKLRRELPKVAPKCKEFNTITLNFESLKFSEHSLILAEQKISSKILRLRSKIDYCSNHLNSIDVLIFKQIEDYINNRQSRQKRITIQDIIKERIASFRELRAVQLEVISSWRELVSIRSDQGFNSTSITIDILEKSNDSSGEVKLSKLIEKMMLMNIEDGTNDFFTMSINELCKSNSVELEFNEFGIELTQTEKCPQEEVRRRNDLNEWFNSIRLKILIGQSFYKNLKTNWNQSRPLEVDLSSNKLIVPLMNNEKVLNLKIKIYSAKTFKLLTTGFPFEATVVARIFTGDANRDFILNDIKLDSEETVAGLKFNTSFQPKLGDEQVALWRFRREKIINFLYDKIFRDYYSSLASDQEKLTKLLKDCDTSFLANILGIKQKPFFALDPCVDYFETSYSQCHDVRHETSDSIRHKLLIWRWVNNLNRPIPLSKSEIYKSYEFKMDDMKSKFGGASVQQADQGYQLIEKARLLAVEYIKQYEIQLEEMMKLNGDRVSNLYGSDNLIELLREPQLELDLSKVVILFKNLIPKRQAHRPLMAKRKSNKPSGVLSKDLLDSRNFDLESQIISHWRNVVSSRVSGANLQLVVTIQQASNVPMRILNPSYPQPASPRPNSPFLTGGSTSPSSFMQVSAVNQPQVSLSPPTTYVEIVFQRQQQASSLAQGKNPAWNETLFFPITNLNKQADSSIIVQEKKVEESQLVDEFLELNLYDYNCYMQDASQNYPTDQNTLLRMSSFMTNPDPIPINSNSINSNRVQTSNQRIERHLLGSLKVPLSTLLSIGRIQGSFALNQPMFLENYQFQQEPLFNQPPMRAKLSKSSQQTSISLFITIDPAIIIPQQLHFRTESHETDRLFEFARLWEQIVSKFNQRSNMQSRNVRRARNNLETREINRQRHIRVLVLQQDAKYCIITRLIWPLCPPKELIETRSSMQDKMCSLARFVSLLSPLKYGLLNIRLLASSLWFDSLQLINRSLGGFEEKAVLLCNYFLHLGKCSALLLGDALPEGRCVYVIVWNDQSRLIEDQLQLRAKELDSSTSIDSSTTFEAAMKPVEQSDFISRLPILINSKSIEIWEPNSGKSYTLDEQLQLFSIGSIVTIENVYANIQSTDNITETNYDIRSKNLWFPLFEASSNLSYSSSTLNRYFNSRKTNQLTLRRQIAQLETMRKSIGYPALPPLITNNNASQFNYTKFSQHQCDELKAALERTIKAALLKWRPDRPTYFNRTLSQLLVEKLSLFESYTEKGSKQVDDWKSELAELIRNEVLMVHLSLSGGLNSRQVVSWPINIPYTGMKTILDSLFASGVHNADLELDSSHLNYSSSTQFLVACNVYAYPAKVMSVWLYVAAIVTNKGLSRTFLSP